MTEITTEAVRRWYATWPTTTCATRVVPEHLAEFDRWFAEVTKEAYLDGLRDGITTCCRCGQWINPVDPGRDLCTRCAQHEAIAYHTNRLRNGNQVDPSAAATTTNPSPTIPPINNHGGRMPPPPEPAWLDEPEPEEIL